MKNIITPLGILFFSHIVFAQKINDDFTGKWKASKGAIIIVTRFADKLKIIVRKGILHKSIIWVRQ